MKRKLKLSEIKVQSFVTSVSKNIKGGTVANELTIIDCGGSRRSCNNDELSCNPVCWGRTNEGPVCPLTGMIKG